MNGDTREEDFNSSTSSMQAHLKVLAVSNHWAAAKDAPFLCIFMDRQLNSLKNIGVRVDTFDIGKSHSPFKLFQRWLELRKEVRQLKPDIVHSLYGTISGFLSVFSGRPTVVSFCGSDLLPGASISPLRRYLGFLLSNLSALCARGIICKSEGLRSALWWRQSLAVIIPNGVDLELFSPGAQNEARFELKWDMYCPIVIHNVGNDPIRKGLEVAETAMSHVASRIPEAKLHIISGVEPHRMPLYYRAADVLLCASKAEGSPNVIKEALACNLPIVSCSVGDVSERLKGVYPSTVVPRDPKCMADAIVDIILTRSRSNGREQIKHLALNRVATNVIKCYENALRLR